MQSGLVFGDHLGLSAQSTSTTSKRHSTLCVPCASVHTNFDQVLRACTHHSVFTTTTFRRFFSNAKGGLLTWGGKVEFQPQVLAVGSLLE